MSIIPHNILKILPINNDRVVLRLAFVRTLCAQLSRFQHALIDRRERHVVSRRQPCLKQMHTGVSVRDDLAADADTDAARRVYDVDALEWILGVDVDGRVLLEPMI